MTIDEPDVDLRLWGKWRGLLAPYPLIWHLVDTGAVAGRLWDRYLTTGQRRVIAAGLGVDEGHARRLVMLWASLHDLGKAIPGFQGQDLAAASALRGAPEYGGEGSGRLPHDRATQVSLVALLAGYGYENEGLAGTRPCALVAQALGGHHGRFHQVSRSDRRFLGGGGWARQREALVEVLDQALGSPKAPISVAAPCLVLVTGLVILADWLASQEDFLRRQLPCVPQVASVQTVAARFEQMGVEADRLLAAAGLGVPRLRAAGFEEMFSFAPNALQRSVIDELLPQVSGPGMLVVTAATGDGKTETSLTAALALAARCGASGLYFALPTMATADEMYRRVRRFVEAVASGPAPITLLHSMAWLNAAYEAQSEAGLDGSGAAVSTDGDARVAAPHWLRGRKRGMLAPFGAGTIDQALMTAMTTKHNALRMLGMSGKVFIVDEAHSYDEYTQRLLQKLLNWLGYFRCPVVLLSATIPVSQVRKLVSAYQRGAGVTATERVDIRYPGWTFVPASPSGRVLAISARAQAMVAAGRVIDLQVQVRPVRHLRGRIEDHRDRRLVIRTCLAPLLQEGGRAAVVCNTVADAQLTYLAIREWVGDRAEVRLLHSRFPASRREQITREITGRLGRDATTRPERMIVVATQVIEQSLDLDFDVVVSDLAPMAQLLQRAGRCHRHDHPRPAWATRPMLVVLEPHGAEGFAKPPHWGDVYHPYLLRSTRQRLAGVTGIRVPDDVQGHVEAVYGPPQSASPQAEQEYIDYLAKGVAGQQVADLYLIPDATALDDLVPMTDSGLSEQRAATRLGADSARVVCCYLGRDGSQWLDPRRERRLPAGGRLSRDDVREVLGLSIPVPENLVQGYIPPVPAPSSWQHNAWLAEVQPLWFTLGPNGPAPIDIGGRRVWLDADLGLVVERS
ncbi:CRISPR-associated helicase Cas3' [Micromonospora sp. NPDC048898]|uniref:CRISPR-associated helicase Cas3' n=1 Tax=Micromonospora sp. NPDC048898 TaxID=3364260 RepID=UPI0037175FAB